MNLASGKVFLRRSAVWLSRLIMNALSQPYEISRAPCLILAPHQDDETLACGALIARKRHEGQEIHIVFLTDGGASHPGHPSLSVEELIRLRRREAMAALGILGVDSACVHFWNEPDGTLKTLSSDHREMIISRLAAMLVSVKPGRLFVPCSPDGSSEHDPVLGLAQAALAKSGQAPAIWQYPIWCWWNPVLLFSKIFRQGGIQRLDGEDYHALKQRALRCYRSQTEPIAPVQSIPLPPELREFCLQDPEYFFVTQPDRPRKTAAEG